MSDFDFNDVPIAIRKTADGDTYEIGAVLHGKLLVFGAYKAGGFEDDLAEAQEAEKAQASEPAEPSPPSPPSPPA